MSGFWQALIAGLTVAAITGLTVLAYRHPEGYRRIYVPIVAAIVVAWVGCFLFSLAYTLGSSKAILDTIQLNTPTTIKTPAHTPILSGWYSILMAVAVSYLLFLRSLPDILKVESRKGAEP